MDKYKINISSKGDGWSDNKSVSGEVCEEDGAVLISYCLDGDECVLCVKDGKVTQQRRGGQCVKITFEKGHSTECAIGSGSFSGSFEVYTKSIKFISGKGGCKLYLEYNSGSDGELIKLTFTAVKKGVL